MIILKIILKNIQVTRSKTSKFKFVIICNFVSPPLMIFKAALKAFFRSIHTFSTFTPTETVFFKISQKSVKKVLL